MKTRIHDDDKVNSGWVNAYSATADRRCSRKFPTRLITRLSGIRHVVITKAECDRFLREQTDIAKLGRPNECLTNEALQKQEAPSGKPS